MQHPIDAMMGSADIYTTGERMTEDQPKVMTSKEGKSDDTASSKHFRKEQQDQNKAQIKQAKLERKRYLNRMSWRRKQVREKDQLHTLAKEKGNLNSKNTSLHSENVALRALIKKLRNPKEFDLLLRQLVKKKEKRRYPISAAAESKPYLSSEGQALRNLFQNQTLRGMFLSELSKQQQREQQNDVSSSISPFQNQLNMESFENLKHQQLLLSNQVTKILPRDALLMRNQNSSTTSLSSPYFSSAVEATRESTMPSASSNLFGTSLPSMLQQSAFSAQTASEATARHNLDKYISLLNSQLFSGPKTANDMIAAATSKILSEKLSPSSQLLSSSETSNGMLAAATSHILAEKLPLNSQYLPVPETPNNILAAATSHMLPEKLRRNSLHLITDRRLQSIEEAVALSQQLALIKASADQRLSSFSFQNPNINRSINQMLPPDNINIADHRIRQSLHDATLGGGSSNAFPGIFGSDLAQSRRFL